MTILAGEVVTAGRLGLLQTKTYNVTPSGSLTVTTTVTDIPGCSIVLTTVAANAVYAVTASIDCIVSSTDASSLIEARLVIDGVDQAGRSVYGMDTADRATVVQLWDGVLAAPGSHTFTLRGARTGSGAGTIANSNSRMRIEITEVA